MNLVQRMSALLQGQPSSPSIDTDQPARQMETESDTDHMILAARVEEALAGDPVLKLTRIRAEAFLGVVQLSGCVGTQAHMDRAIRLASEVQGVTSIKNCMQVT